jgi:glycosyltransferase involved in cell wall biosynthesis
MKDVIHIITTISMGGAEKQLLTLVREQVKSGRIVKVIYLQGKPELLDLFLQSGAQVIDKFANKNPIIQAFLIKHYFRMQGECVVHCHLPRAELFGTLAPERIKIVVSRHNAEPFFPGAPQIISRVLSRHVTERATYVIAISDAVKNYLIAFKEVVDPAKVHVIYYGFSQNENADLANTEKLKEVKNKNLVIGTVSRLVPQKDLGTLLRAFKIFQNSRPEANLVIVGEGHLEQELRELSRELCIESKVIWFGRTSDINSIVGEFDVFALTSLYEGFGLVLLEAMANSVPIVAARNSAIPEVLGRSYEGLFETGNFKQLAGLLESSLKFDQNIRMKEYLSERLQIFQPDKMRIKVDEIYLQMETL